MATRKASRTMRNRYGRYLAKQKRNTKGRYLTRKVKPFGRKATKKAVTRKANRKANKKMNNAYTRKNVMKPAGFFTKMFAPKA
jgi:hypothetical protein